MARDMDAFLQGAMLGRTLLAPLEQAMARRLAMGENERARLAEAARYAQERAWREQARDIEAQRYAEQKEARLSDIERAERGYILNLLNQIEGTKRALAVKLKSDLQNRLVYDEKTKMPRPMTASEMNAARAAIDKEIERSFPSSVIWKEGTPYVNPKFLATIGAYGINEPVFYKLMEEQGIRLPPPEPPQTIAPQAAAPPAPELSSTYAEAATRQRAREFFDLFPPNRLYPPIEPHKIMARQDIGTPPPEPLPAREYRFTPEPPPETPVRANWPYLPIERYLPLHRQLFPIQR